MALSSTLGLQATRVLGAALGDPIASFLLRKECRALGFDLRSIDETQFLVLVDHLESPMKDVLGEKLAREMVTDLKRIALTEN